MRTTTTLNTDTLRRLALMQHLGEDFFILADADGQEKAFEGEEDAAKEQFDLSHEEEEGKTFFEFCNENCTEVEELEEDDFSVDYRVLTDDEADEAWEDSLNSYLEECVYPELPDNMARYFDDEAWKRDARIDGRGHSLSSYDGNEKEETVGGETFYIFRTN